MAHRESLPTLLYLLKLIGRLDRQPLSESDRQMIKVLLLGVSKDQDVREYFWQSVKNRPKQHNPLHYHAAMMAAIAEATGDKLGKRIKTIQKKTGLSKDQVGYAKKEYLAQARKELELFGLEFCEAKLAGQLSDLSIK